MADDTVVDLDQLKAQLRIDDSDNDDVLELKLAAAQSHLERLLGFKLDAATYPSVDGAEFPDSVPAALREAVLQLAAHWYERREAVLIGENAQEMPIGMNDIVTGFRNWSWAG